jgi:hypothetical protein
MLTRRSFIPALPELPAYPEEVDGWRALAPKLAARVFGLGNKPYQRESTIRNVNERIKPEFGWQRAVA